MSSGCMLAEVEEHHDQAAILQLSGAAANWLLTRSAIVFCLVVVAPETVAALRQRYRLVDVLVVEGGDRAAASCLRASGSRSASRPLMTAPVFLSRTTTLVSTRSTLVMMVITSLSCWASGRDRHSRRRDHQPGCQNRRKSLCASAISFTAPACTHNLVAASWPLEPEPRVVGQRSHRGDAGDLAEGLRVQRGVHAACTGRY